MNYQQKNYSLYEQKLNEIFKSHNECMNKQWLNSKIPSKDILFVEQYYSKTELIQNYYNSYDIELENNSDILYPNIYMHPLNDEIIKISIDPKKKLFYYDTLFRKLIDYCITNGYNDPLTEKPLINPDIKNKFYSWLKNNK
jgi:hypothetical protein